MWQSTKDGSNWLVFTVRMTTLFGGGNDCRRRPWPGENPNNMNQSKQTKLPLHNYQIPGQHFLWKESSRWGPSIKCLLCTPFHSSWDPPFILGPPYFQMPNPCPCWWCPESYHHLTPASPGLTDLHFPRSSCCLSHERWTNNLSCNAFANERFVHVHGHHKITAEHNRN